MQKSARSAKNVVSVTKRPVMFAACLPGPSTMSSAAREAVCHFVGKVIPPATFVGVEQLWERPEGI
jgi:hypothetical protein